MHPFYLIAYFLIPLSARAQAETVTLYEIKPDHTTLPEVNTPRGSLEAVGVLSDGATVYTYAATASVYFIPVTTSTTHIASTGVSSGLTVVDPITVTSTSAGPTATLHGTVVADSAHYQLFEAAIATDPLVLEGGKLVECTFNGQGVWGCVRHGVNVGQSTTDVPQGGAYTYMGSAVPYSTLTVDKTSLRTLSSFPTLPRESTSSNGVHGGALFVSGGAIAIGVALGFALVI